MTDINKLTDFEKGEYDCLHLHEAAVNASEAYLLGYGQQYAREETISGQYTDQSAQCKSQLEQWGIAI